MNLKHFIVALLILATALSGQQANLQEQDVKSENIKLKGDSRSKRLSPFSGLFRNSLDVITGYNSLYFIGGGVSTYALVKSGADRDIQDWFIEKNPLGSVFPVGMYWAGMIVQPSVGAGMYLGGLLVDNNELIAGGSAVLQAIGINAVYTMGLKYMTGRTRPGEHNSADDFEFKPWKRDILTKRQSWPSGHTSATFVMVATLHAFFDEPWFAWVGHPFSIFMGLSMVDWDYHWASDVVAGALMGAAIGYTVGYNFRAMYNKSTLASKGDVKPGDFKMAGISPILLPTGIGIEVRAAFQ